MPAERIPPLASSRTFRSTLNVRGYELDSFGHVNHGVYVSYLEQARWQMLLDAGITLESFARWKAWPVIARVELDYLKPAYLGDELVIETSHLDHGRSWIEFSQVIFKAGAPIVRARVKVVTVNEAKRPTQVPEPMATCWLPPDYGQAHGRGAGLDNELGAGI